MEREPQGMMKRETSKEQKWNTNLETTKEEESVQARMPESLYPGGRMRGPHQHKQLWEGSGRAESQGSEHPAGGLEAEPGRWRALQAKKERANLQPLCYTVKYQ